MPHLRAVWRLFKRYQRMDPLDLDFKRPSGVAARNSARLLQTLTLWRFTPILDTVDKRVWELPEAQGIIILKALAIIASKRPHRWRTPQRSLERMRPGEKTLRQKSGTSGNRSTRIWAAWTIHRQGRSARQSFSRLATRQAWVSRMMKSDEPVFSSKGPVALAMPHLSITSRCHKS